jgi:putative endopeptidase
MRIQSFPSLLVLSGSLLVAANCQGQSLSHAPEIVFDTPGGPSAEPKKPIIFDLPAIDKTADPCTNFYQYACGNWMKNNPIPSDQARLRAQHLPALLGPQVRRGSPEDASAEEVR